MHKINQEQSYDVTAVSLFKIIMDMKKENVMESVACLSVNDVFSKVRHDIKKLVDEKYFHDSNFKLSYGYEMYLLLNEYCAFLCMIPGNIFKLKNIELWEKHFPITYKHISLKIKNGFSDFNSLQNASFSAALNSTPETFNKYCEEAEILFLSNKEAVIDQSIILNNVLLNEVVKRINDLYLPKINSATFRDAALLELNSILEKTFCNASNVNNSNTINLRSAPNFSKVYTLQDYVESKFITFEQMLSLREMLLMRKNILIIGGVGVGKTTFCNALLHEIEKIDAESNIIIIENFLCELECSMEDKECFLVPASNQMPKVTDEILLRHSIMRSPNRMVIEDARDTDVCSMIFEKWHSRDNGVLITMHAINSEIILKDSGLNTVSKTISDVFCVISIHEQYYQDEFGKVLKIRKIEQIN